MTKRIVKNLELLKALHQCNKPEQKQLLKTIRPTVVNAICDCIHNVLQGNVSISPNQKKALQSKKNVLRQLVNKKNKSDQRKKLLIQHGSGILNSILGPVLNTLAGLVL